MEHTDPWTFTDTITVYNWEKHPEWDKCPMFSNELFMINTSHHREYFYMMECKRILHSIGCIGWDNILQKDIFKSSDGWKINKFYPVELSNTAKELYRVNYPYRSPILTHSVDVPYNKPYVKSNGIWKIYYSGGSDTGSLYVNTINRFKMDAQACYKPFQLMYFPSVNINFPQLLSCNEHNDRDGKKNSGIIYDNISKFKVQIE